MLAKPNGGWLLVGVQQFSSLTTISNHPLIFTIPCTTFFIGCSLGGEGMFPSKLACLKVTPKQIGLGQIVVALLPSLILAWACSRLPQEQYRLGVALTAGLFVVSIGCLSQRQWTVSQNVLFAIVLYAGGYGILRWMSPEPFDSVTHFLLGVLLSGMVVILIVHEILGTKEGRKARFLAEEFCQRVNWPADEKIREMPEVKEFRQSLHEDPTVALQLAHHPNPRVKLAALSALELWPHWRTHQAQVLIELLPHLTEPVLKGAALLALASVRKDHQIACLVPYLCDRSLEVRQRAHFAILSEVNTRWPLIREGVRNALFDPLFARDGYLPWSGLLPQAALDDLINWSAETGPGSHRTLKTILRHCQKAIQEEGTPEAIERVTRIMSDPKAPAALRVEVGQVLREANEFSPELAAKFIDQSTPTALRLMAAGVLLGVREDPRAIEVLREVARQPNRELALAAAELIQRCLGVDMGLPMGEALPDVKSRHAAEVARRVLAWASGEIAAVESVS